MAKKPTPRFTPPTLEQYPRMFEYFDDEERELIESYERGEWKPMKNQEALKAQLRAAAENHMRKKERINIRLTRADLLDVKRSAELDGLPYQTLIASLIHKHNVERFGPKH